MRHRVFICYKVCISYAVAYQFSFFTKHSTEYDIDLFALILYYLQIVDVTPLEAEVMNLDLILLLDVCVGLATGITLAILYAEITHQAHQESIYGSRGFSQYFIVSCVLTLPVGLIMGLLGFFFDRSVPFIAAATVMVTYGYTVLDNLFRSWRLKRLK